VLTEGLPFPVKGMWEVEVTKAQVIRQKYLAIIILQTILWNILTTKTVVRNSGGKNVSYEKSGVRMCAVYH
jgi:hypothetical protein